MIETTFNYFDIAVISIMLLSCIFAFFRGFVREVLSFAAWVGAGIITIHYYRDVATMFDPYFKHPAMAAMAASLTLYISSLIVFAIFNSYIIKILKSGSSLGMMDNFLGLVFGGLRGVFIISLGYFLMSITVNEAHQPDWLKNAATRPMAEHGAQFLTQLAPADYLEDIADIQTQAAQEAQQQKDAATSAASDAYNNAANSTKSITAPTIDKNMLNEGQSKLNQVLHSTGSR